MTGREDQKENDLFFLCSLIEYIGRKTKNYRSTVVNALGKKELQHIYDYADVYHCENIDKVTDELVEKHHIEEGYFDNVSTDKIETQKQEKNIENKTEHESNNIDKTIAKPNYSIQMIEVNKEENVWYKKIINAIKKLFRID